MIKGSEVGRAFVLPLLVLATGTSWSVHAEDKPADTNLEEKKWKFEPGNRRDPFVFIPKVDVVQKDDPPEMKNVVAPATYYAEAMSAFLEQNRDEKLRETLAKCEAGLQGLADDPNTAGDPRAQDLRERLIDLRKAAQRVIRRKEVEQKFKSIPLRLTGIVRRDHGSQAIVNSRLAKKGDVVAAADDSVVVLEEIRADEIIVVFEGYRMLLNLADSSK